ncbi:ArsO family NAD(P)H-dependent flavin-containing monooxygenase [Micrococcoides hystricis]|uniref:ArsO family NAD(P)H-dependent flavin-containing monooxygenase n=1 Tax=Micrococcoides hystricis TaxID=1572761 RepID=A0ABV6P929_9MICC
MTNSAPADTESVHQVDVVIIGAGQAGLAAGFYLNRLRRDARTGRIPAAPSFVLLDAEETPGGSWQHYWPSLELFSPAQFSSLSGYQMPINQGPNNPGKDHVVEYLTTYEQRYALPIERPVTVTRVDPDEHAFVVHTDRGRWRCCWVISATGSWNLPFVPDVPGRETFEGTQVHTHDYAGPEPYADQQVVVVGGANSGAQIAADVLPHAANVDWATLREPVYLPDHVDGRALFQIASRRVRALAAGDEEPVSVGSLGDIIVVPSVKAARDAGDLVSRRMFVELTPAGPRWPDGSVSHADAIIWCTGFKHDLRHVSGLAGLGGGEDDAPRTQSPLLTASVDHPGLYFLGYGDWCGPASAPLIGVGTWARDTVAAIAAEFASGADSEF